jgi:hypothetical protein
MLDWEIFTMGKNERELPFENLRRRCDPEVFGFASTAELPALEEIIGQDRAARAGRFHIYPVSTIDKGIEILTGVRAGEPDDEGHYPKHTLGFAVQSRLQDFAEKMKGFAAAAREEKPQSEKV